MAISLMSEFFVFLLFVCPRTCVLGQKLSGNVDSTVNRLRILGCFTTKIIILMNCMEQKLGCFSEDLWLEEYLDPINMEQAACLLNDFNILIYDILVSSVND